MAATPDSEHVGRIENEVLRRFCTARDAGDEAAADAHWQRLMTIFFDRIPGWVAAEHQGRLDAQERRDAVAAATMRICVGLRRTFAGSSVGEFVNAAKRAVKFACIDTQRKAQRLREHETSLDAQRWDDDRDGYDAPAHEAPKDRVSTAEAEQLEEDFFAGESAFLDWAVPRLPKRPREVFELMRQGKQTKEIMEILGINENNVHVSYKRALEKLRTLRPDYEP